LLRPFNFETLATRVYRIASDERLAEAAPAALILIGLSLVPVLWLDAIGPSRPRSAPSRD
jgi:iron(III) transport system permease protein